LTLIAAASSEPSSANLLAAHANSWAFCLDVAVLATGDGGTGFVGALFGDAELPLMVPCGCAKIAS